MTQEIRETNIYKKQSRIFLSQAYEELERGDLPQASEKGWGAATQILKAIAQERGWEHFSHRDVMRTVDSLERETGDDQLGILFASATHLHVNFYENTYAKKSIGNHLHRVTRFVDKAEAFLPAAV